MKASAQNGYATFEAIKQTVSEKLNRLNPHFTYHNLAHTLDVVEQCERIALAEGINDHRTLFLIKLAALYHDTGFLKTYRNHEEVSCSIFLEEATAYNLSPEEKELVCRLIMATKLPQRPTDLYERIICDADLDYLGRPDFFSIGDGLRQEFLHYGIVESNEQWEELQIKFLTSHFYHTDSSRNLRESAKQQNLATLH